MSDLISLYIGIWVGYACGMLDADELRKGFVMEILTCTIAGFFWPIILLRTLFK